MNDDLLKGVAALNQNNDQDWTQEAHQAAHNVRKAFQGVYPDEKVDQLARDAANGVMARAQESEPGDGDDDQTQSPGDDPQPEPSSVDLIAQGLKEVMG